MSDVELLAHLEGWSVNLNEHTSLTATMSPTSQELYLSQCTKYSLLVSLLFLAG